MTQPNQQLTALQVSQLHRQADTDSQPSAAHHTLGPSGTQAAPGNHRHDGQQSKRLYDPPGSVTGSRGGNAALQSLLTVLAQQGIITNNTTA